MLVLRLFLSAGDQKFGQGSRLRKKEGISRELRVTATISMGKRSARYMIM